MIPKYTQEINWREREKKESFDWIYALLKQTQTQNHVIKQSLMLLYLSKSKL